jgi:putative molybdopterin biosynthesis protein
MAVKSKIQQFRKESRLTQADLANVAGISRQAYTAIESGKSVPSTEIALRLARALKVRVEDLFELNDADSKTIEVELIGGINSVPEGTRVQLVGFGPRRLARPLTEGSFTSHIFNPTDAIALSARGDRRVELKLLNESAVHTATLLLAGSDPATSILAQMIYDISIRLIWVEAESIASLRALARGEVHIAGCDFRDRTTGLYNTPLVHEIVPFPCTIIRFAVWRQGIIVGSGNPKSIHHIDDLVRPNVTLINRQPGAGSRGLLNRLIWESGISAGDIRGYDRTVNGHLAAGEMVASGLADCGIGIEAAARAHELEFLMLNEEPYDLVIPNHLLDTPAVQTLLSLLKSRQFRRQVESLGGYDISAMGHQVN